MKILTVAFMLLFNYLVSASARNLLAYPIGPLSCYSAARRPFRPAQTWIVMGLALSKYQSTGDDTAADLSVSKASW